MPRPYAERVLENPRSPRVRAVAKLTKRSARQETGLFLLEGPQAAREALALPPETVRRDLRHADGDGASQRRARAARERRHRGRLHDRGGPRRDGRHRHPAGHRRGGTAVADLAARRVRGIPSSHRDLRGGARSRQPRHDHPGGGRRRGGCRRPDRPHRRPVQPQGRPRDDRFALPPAGRVGADLAVVVERAHAAGLRVIAADVGGEDFLASRGTLAEPTAWLFGNEARGLDEEALKLADLVAAAADLRLRRVAESRDRRERVPVRERLRAARRR